MMRSPTKGVVLALAFLVAGLASLPKIEIADNVYNDTTDMQKMVRKYSSIYTNPAYQAFRESVDIIGTWDDHDFGENNGGSWYPMRAASQAALLDFLDDPTDSARRDQNGVYTAYDFGPAGAQVRVILLDTRYHAELEYPPSTLSGVMKCQNFEITFSLKIYGEHRSKHRQSFCKNLQKKS